MEKYKVTITVTRNNQIAKKVKHNIPASKKFQSIGKALYRGYQIEVEGSFFIILTKKDNKKMVTIAMFRQD